MIFAGVFVGPAYAEDLVHEMECKVTSNSVTKVVEGVPEKYNRWNDGFDVGDTLHFTVELHTILGLGLTLRDKIRDEIHFFARFPAMTTNEEWRVDRDLEYDLVRFSSIVADDFDVEVTKGLLLFHVYGDIGTFDRYYKDDWQAIIVNQGLPRDFAHVYTLDCRTTMSGIDQILERLLATP